MKRQPAAALFQRHNRSTYPAMEERFLANSIEMRFTPGETIAHQGEPVDSIFRLVSGTVQSRLVPTAKSGSESGAGRVVAVVTSPGALLGEGGALLERRSSTLVAETDVVLEVIPIDAHCLSDAIMAGVDLGLSIAKSLANRMCEVAHGLRLIDSFVPLFKEQLTPTRPHSGASWTN